MRAVALLSVILLSGCALWPGGLPHTPPPLAALPDETPASASQVLSLEYEGQTLGLQCAFAAGAGEWRLACINVAGLRVLSLRVDAAKQVHAHWAPGVPETLQAQQVAFDLQFALWPQSALQAALEGTAWRLEQTADGHRQLSYRGRTVAVAHRQGPRWNGAGSIHHQGIGYRLQLVTRTHP